MKAQDQCIPCLRRQAERTLSILSIEGREKKRILEIVEEYLTKAELSVSPMQIGIGMNKIIANESGVTDPYEAVKQKSNIKAEKMLEKVIKILAESNDELYAAIKASIAGNIVDYGISSNHNLEHTLMEVMGKEAIINNYDILKQELEKAKKVTLLADNGGEIVFDLLLLEALEKKFNLEKVYLVVKKHPFINDVTSKDLKNLPVHNVKNIEIVEANNENFLDYIDSIRATLDQSDVIIAKGQGNFEIFYNNYKGIFFLFVIKCEVISNIVKKPIGEYVIMRN